MTANTTSREEERTFHHCLVKILLTATVGRDKAAAILLPFAHNYRAFIRFSRTWQRGMYLWLIL
jgi:hypothetical protein